MLAIVILAPVVGASFTGPWPMSPASATGGRFIVGLDAMPALDVSWPGARVLARDAGARFVVVEATDGQAFASAVKAYPGVRYIEIDHADKIVALGTPNDPRFAEQYALSLVRAPAAWDVTLGSTSVKLAILDTGVDRSHLDLDRLLEGADMTGGGSIADGCGHGTHVTGIAGATTDNGRGVAGAAQVTIIPVKVLGSNCAGTFSNIARGVTWASDQGARIISMSLGCSGCTSQALIDAVAYASSKGVLVFAAAGNTGPCTSCVTFPATLPEVVAVGCTTSSDAVCSFSSRGPQVELAAPGSNILSTLRGGSYGTMSGTSMSAPLVAGIAGLVLSNEPGLTRTELRARLVETARDLGAAGRDTSYGYGRIDAAAAVGSSSSPGFAPIARFSAAASELTLNVDGRASSDADGTVESWAWDWGDGSALGSGPTATHVYATAGTYGVRLVVADNEGRTGQTTQSWSVSAPGSSWYAETFDDGLAQGWTLSGLWRVGSDCAGAASAPYSLQYNRASTCTYSTGSRTSGSATLSLDTSGMASPRMTFSHRFEVERTSTYSYDRMRVQASADGGATWSTVFSKDSRSATQASWIEVSLDLASFRGVNTRVRFTFDSVDSVRNAHAGWSIDNVRVD